MYGGALVTPAARPDSRAAATQPPTLYCKLAAAAPAAHTDKVKQNYLLVLADGRPRLAAGAAMPLLVSPAIAPRPGPGPLAAAAPPGQRSAGHCRLGAPHCATLFQPQRL